VLVSCDFFDTCDSCDSCDFKKDIFRENNTPHEAPQIYAVPHGILQRYVSKSSIDSKIYSPAFYFSTPIVA
jgi:hypothetical protein